MARSRWVVSGNSGQTDIMELIQGDPQYPQGRWVTICQNIREGHANLLANVPECLDFIEDFIKECREGYIREDLEKGRTPKSDVYKRACAIFEKATGRKV